MNVDYCIDGRDSLLVIFHTGIKIIAITVNPFQYLIPKLPALETFLYPSQYRNNRIEKIVSSWALELNIIHEYVCYRELTKLYSSFPLSKIAI